jgi:hypothetical protein
MASNSEFTSGQLPLTSRSNQHHVNSITSSVGTITGQLPWFLGATIGSLGSLVVKYLLSIDDSFTLDVADEQLSDAELYSTLRTIGARIQDFQRSNLHSYFNTSECTFKKNIWTPGDLSTYIGDIVNFCAAAHGGHINMIALKNILSALFKEQISREQSTINSTETIVIYSTRHSECGVMKLVFTGEQIEVTNCCLSVKKNLILFRNSQDLLHTLRSFVRASR